MKWIDSLLRRLSVPARPNRKARRAASPRLSVSQLEDRITPANAIWTGDVSNVWSNGANWLSGVAPANGDDIYFPYGATRTAPVYDVGATASTFHSVTIYGSGYSIGASPGRTITLGSLSAPSNESTSFDIDFVAGGPVTVAPGATLSVGGSISGTNGLTVAGGGTLRLTGVSSNEYLGTTAVTGTGTTLVLAKAGATAVPEDLTVGAGGYVLLVGSHQIADTAGVALGDGAVLDLNGFDDTIGGLNLTAATVSTGNGTLTLGGDVTTMASNVPSVISGRLDLGGATRTFDVADGAAGTDLFVGAEISGAGGIIKAGGDSDMTLAGYNTYDGTTQVAAGVLTVSDPNALGATSAGTAVASGATLNFQGGWVFAPEPLVIKGDGSSGFGALWSSNGANVLTGNIFLPDSASIGAEPSSSLTIFGNIQDNGDGYQLTKVRPGTVTLAGTVDTGGVTVSDGVLQADGLLDDGVTLAGGTLSGSGVLNGPVLAATAASVIDPGTAGGAGALTYANPADLVLPTDATFRVDLNGTTVGTGYDRLALTSASALFDPNGAALDVHLGFLPSVGDSFQIVSQTSGTPITGRFNGLGQFGSFTTGPVTFSIGYFNSGVVLTVTGVVPPTFTWDGGDADDSLWSSPDNWVGDVAPTPGAVLVFADGAARLSSFNDLPDGTAFGGITVAGAGYTLGGNAITLGGDLLATYASGASTVATALTFSADATVATAADLTLSGVISGTKNLTKAGTGALTLAAPSLYTGTTTVVAGALLVDGYLNASTVMTVAADATVGGTGLLPATTVAAGGTLAPGHSTGVISTGDLTLDGGAVFSVELDGPLAGDEYDRVDVSGSVTLADAALALSLGYTPAPGQTFTVIANDGVDSVSGTFAGLAEGSTLTLAGSTFLISYVGGDGNDVTLTFLADTAVAVTSSGTPSVFGQSVTFTATVTGAGIPTGTVTFVDATTSTTLGSSPLEADGTATLVTNVLPIGTTTIQAVYSGGAGYAGSSGTVDQLVVAPVPSGGGGGPPTTEPPAPQPPAAEPSAPPATPEPPVAEPPTPADPAAPETPEVPAPTAPAAPAAPPARDPAPARVPVTVTGTAPGAPGIVRTYDATTGAPLATFAPFGAYAGGVKVGLGDVNGDGVADVVVMAGPGSQNGHVKIYSGRDASMLADYVAFPAYAGELNMAVGDVDGDGAADVIFATASGFDYVAVNSGTTQNLLTVFSAAGGFTGGLTVAAGDFDGDGRDDIVVGTASRVGVAAVFSGLVPTPVAVFGELAGFGGVNVAAGDIDGDGRADVVLGTASGVPVVTAHDGATQRMRGAFVANYGLGSGVRVATADHNGDGIADVVTGFGGPVPLVSVYSGLSLSPLDAFLAQTPGMADSPQGVYVG